jgi:hypothetical protein
VALGVESTILDLIWKTSVQEQVVVVRMDQARNSLEQAFLDAVRS